MTSKIELLNKKGLIKPPKFLVGGTHYEVIMGSTAYGVSGDASDCDIYGFGIPPKDYLFPHLRGEIVGFSTPGPRFDQWQQHHVVDKEARKEYDLTIFSIIKYFKLCMNCNPNMIDSLFVPFNCVIHSTKIGNLVRDNRKLFLSKKGWGSFRGYSFAQMHKMKSQTRIGKRKEEVEKWGFSLKFAYHTVRLLNEIEEILESGDLTLNKNSEQLKAIRRGDWSLKEIEDYFIRKEKSLEELYTKSELPHKPRENEITELLLNCLEEHFGDLKKLNIEKKSNEKDVLNNIIKIIEGYQR